MSVITGNPPECLDNVKLVITNGGSHVFEIELPFDIFLHQNFIHFDQVFCLLHRFEVKADVHSLDKFFMKIKNLACI